MFKTVLLPIDLSSEASWTKALPAALEILRGEGAVLHVATVVPTFGYPVVGGYFSADFEKKALHEAGERLATWVAEHVGDRVEVHPHVLHGRVYDEILQAGDKLDVDAIVMASHRPELSDYLIGPNADRVVRHSTRSVFVIRG